ncbi:hypothetical protein GCM10027432_22230 [Lysobacter fragariae]
MRSAQSADAAADAATTTAPEPDVQSQLQSTATTQDDGERKFIRTASARFRVKEVYSAALAIEDLVAQHGGFVVRNNISTQVESVQSHPSGDGKLIELATYSVNGDLQVRVPSARAQAFLRAMAGQVEFLDSRNFEAMDAQFELLRQQLAYAREQQAQRALGDIAQGPGKVGDRADVVAARTGSQAQRDEAMIAQRTYEDRIAFATIDLSVYQSQQVRRTERPDVAAIVRDSGPGFFTRLGHSLAVGWYALLDVVVALAGLWPLWLVVAALTVALRRWRRTGRREG